MYTEKSVHQDLIMTKLDLRNIFSIILFLYSKQKLRIFLSSYKEHRYHFVANFDSLISLPLASCKNVSRILSPLHKQQKSINAIFIDPPWKYLRPNNRSPRLRSIPIKWRSSKKGELLILHHPSAVQTAAARWGTDASVVRSRSLSANGTRQKRNRNAGQSLCSVRPPARARPPVPGNDNHYRGMIAASGPPARQPRYWGMETTL